MTGAFAKTISGILDQKSELQLANEKAVEMFVVLPLLTQLGWNTTNLAEVFPQQTLEDKSKADFELRINGESKIVIEVKTWKQQLNNEHEEQLAGYCQLTKPTLAVLTNGLRWQLYLPPNRTKNSPLKEFLDFDITGDGGQSPDAVECHFRRFLARNRIDSKDVVKEAKVLHKEREQYDIFKKNFITSWNEFASDKDGLEDLLSTFCEKKDIPSTPENVRRFLDSLNDPLVNEVPTKSQTKKPAVFLLPKKPDGNSKRSNDVPKTKSWNNLLLQLSRLMQERHPHDFRQNVLSMSHRFSENENVKFPVPICDGIYAKKKGTSQEIKQDCYKIVEDLGYLRDSLVIKDSKGAIL